MKADTTDYKQIAFKLQDDIKEMTWLRDQKDLKFLREMRGRMMKYREKRDATQLEFVLEMIDHWIKELEEN